MIAGLLLAGLVVGVSPPLPLPVPVAALYARPQEEREMLADINAARRAAGVGPLAFDPQLAGIARSFARDMVARRYFGHFSPEGTSLADRLKSARLRYTYAGENLAFNQDEAHAQNGLLSSPPHRAAVLDPRFRKVGIGVIGASIYGAVYVQEFSD
jgi:uncharacterized protein YkwD